MGDASDVEKSIRRNIYAPNYFQLSEDNEADKALDSICTQDDALQNMWRPDQERIKAESIVGVVPKYEILVDATVLAKEERKSQACTFDQGEQEFGCFFWLSRPELGPAMHVQEIFFNEISQRILISYYFSRSRPPEQDAYVNRFQWWKLLCVRDIRWGPPSKLCLVILVFNLYWLPAKIKHVIRFPFLVVRSTVRDVEKILHGQTSQAS